MKKKTIFALGLIVIFALPAFGQSEPYESYYLYLGDYPHGASPGWHEDVQGLTHDENYWYITQSDADDSNKAERSLWKIPVEHDLAKSATPGVNGVERVIIDDIPELAGQGYNHWGDLDYYQYEGVGYLFLPMEGGKGNTGMAVLRADNLQYIDHYEFALKYSAWCAVDHEGFLYFSEDFFDVPRILKYYPHYENIKDTGSLDLTIHPHMDLYDENGVGLTVHRVQGGTFSEYGRYIYLVSNTDGIHVFDTQTGSRVQKSTNGHGYFNYQFDETGWGGYEEPEGITFWDLDDDPRVPEDTISGQLHVFLLDNEAGADERIAVLKWADLINRSIL